MSSPSTPPHISSSWSWPSPRRPRLDDEQGSFAELSDENDTIAIAIPLPTEIEQQDASMPLNESEFGSAIMSNAFPIIVGVALLLIGLHLAGVF